MISDEERRRVAANLRQHLKKYETPDWRAFCNIILGSGRLNNLRKAQAFDRLAELIDRPAGIATEESDGYGKCRTCGASFIVSVPAAFRCEEESEADYCPFCGTPLEWRYEDD